MSFKAEVLADSSGQFVANALRFATESEADSYARDLASRWTLVRDTRVVPATEPVNARWEEKRGIVTEVLPTEDA